MVGKPRDFALHGLVIRTDLPLFENEVASAEPDLIVERGPSGFVDVSRASLLAEFRLVDRTWYLGYRHEGGYLLRFPTLCDFLISQDLTRLEIRSEDDLDDEAIALLLSGGAMAFVLALGNHCVLHAGAVALEAGAVAFAGPAGTGKSTCTALVSSQGAPLVTDDVLRVDLSESPVAIRGSAAIRLRPKAMTLLDYFSDRPRTRRTYDDRLAVYPTRAPMRLPLAAIVIPRPDREIEQVRIEPVTGVAALTSLLMSARIVGWQEPQQQREQFEQTAELSRSVPVYRARVPWKEPIPSEVASGLREALERVV